MKTLVEHLSEKGLDFLIQKEAIYYGDGTVVPGSYALVRADNKAFLSLAKGRYQPVANRYAVSFIDEIVGGDSEASFKARIEKVEGFEGGKKLQVTLKFPESYSSRNHTIEKTVVIRNSHDSSEAITACLVVKATDKAGKTVSSNMGNKEFKCRHTKNVTVKLNTAQATLNLMDSYYLAIQEDFVALDRVSVGRELLNPLLDVVAPPTKKGRGASNRLNAEEYLSKVMGSEERVSLLKVFLALTDYLNSGRVFKDESLRDWKACSRDTFLLTRKLFLKTKELLTLTEGYSYYGGDE